MQSSNALKYIKTSEWDVEANRYMQPRVSDRGLKMISIISNQKNKKLHIQIPATKCWGIEDYVDPATQESDGKFKAKFHFTDNGSPESQETLEKLKAFEEKLIQDAVTNSMTWFGKKLSRELVEDRYMGFLKVGKNKETREPDPSRGYYFSPKVNCYDNKWDIEIFNIENQSIVFPGEEVGDRTPVDYVSKGDDVIGGIECKYVWIGPKGWGVTWALKQCAVKPKDFDTTEGLLQLDLGQSFDSPAPVKKAPVKPQPKVQETVEESTPEEKEETVEMKANPLVDTPKQENFVEDSDEDQEQEQEQEQEPEPEPVKKVVKKSVVKKAVPAKEEQPEPEAEPEAAPKKVVKKVVRKKA
jgi:hypothetical protein